MSNVLRSNPQLDHQLSQAQDPESLRQLLHNTYENAGVIAHERGGDAFVAQHATAPAPAPAPINRDSFSASARRTLYVFGNLRVDLSGVDDDNLDLVEQRIRSAFEQ
jgi:hypothetical protein